MWTQCLKITKNVSFQCIAIIAMFSQKYLVMLSHTHSSILTQSFTHFRFDLVDLPKLQSNESNWIWKCFYDTNWTSIYEIKHNLPIENPIKLAFQIHNDGRRPQVQKRSGGVGAFWLKFYCSSLLEKYNFISSFFSFPSAVVARQMPFVKIAFYCSRPAGSVLCIIIL